MVRKQDASKSKLSKLSKQLSKRARKRVREERKQSSISNKSALKSALNWLMDDEDMFTNDAFHGNINWDPTELVTEALIWSLQEARNVTDAFDQALKVCDELELERTAKTYPRFMNALNRYKKILPARMKATIQTRAEEIAGRFWRDNDWVLMAFDGSRVSVPRTVSNEDAFCAANYGEGKTAKYRKKKSKGMRRRQNEKNKPQPQAPQVWITMIWHMGLRLPWTWRLGPSDSSERGHVVEMLQEDRFPSKTLFCGDAGFVGYPLWSQIMYSKADFLVRVGANVKLLSEYADIKRIKDHVVLCWPKDKMNSGAKPLRLRLVKVKIGKTTMWMLTSVLSRKKLSKKQIVRYYKMRWGIEVQYRGLKQTLDNRKLRCRNCNHVLAELDWSIFGMAVAELFALREQIPTSRAKSKQPKYETSDRSLAESVRAIRNRMRYPNEIPQPNKGLFADLSMAVVQKYHNKTDKKARYRPRNPDKKPLGDPEIRKLNAEERRKLRDIAQNLAA